MCKLTGALAALKYLIIYFLLLFNLNNGFAGNANCDRSFELSTQGHYVIDQCGNRFKLKSVNWYGAHDFAEIPGGLEKQTLTNIVNLIKQGGFNSVRLSFSNRMLHNNNFVEFKRINANPELQSKTPLQIFDSVVNALTSAGIVVILNNHTTISEWCCGYDYNGIWNHPYAQSTYQWMNDWVMLAARYRDNPYVAGFDLRNEVRTGRYYNTYIPVFPNWGLGDKNDWKLAATDAGNVVHDVNPKLLIIVEGINWFGVPLLNGYRPLLAPVRTNPIQLRHPNKLVYEVHNYSYTGPKHTGDDRVSRWQVRYRDMDENTLKKTLDSEFGFVLEDGHDYTAPVWLGEYGIGSDNVSDQDKQWFKRINNYLIEHDMGWAYWALNSERADGSPESYGLLNESWTDYRKDWRYDELKNLLAH